ncbi:retrotransposon protein, putative, ty1-copia subclass [Tanacetum coccineum]
MMNLTTLPLSFWVYALESATCILNMVLTKKVDKTPYELWYGKVPNLSYLKVWGCKALMKHDTPDKLQSRSVKCIFVGYPKETMGYYFYFPLENKIVVARYTEFFEKNLISQEASRRAVELEEIQDEDTSPFENSSEHLVEAESLKPQEGVAPVRRSLRRHQDPERFCINVEWLDAMNAEMQPMKDNQVWRLVDLHPNAKTVGTKGYSQTYGIDYEETFSLVAEIRAIRVSIAISAYHDYEI